MLRLLIFPWFIVAVAATQTLAYDHNIWNVLLDRHVQALDGGKVTAVDYRGMANDREMLAEYLQQLAGVSQKQFEALPGDDQLAFLINAYNAWTVELILTDYPDIDSIKDLGSFFQSPWEKRFADLLGKKRTLDEIEHDLIRGSGRYNEPRIHFAVNCASIGCPALKTEAYTGTALERQLEEATTLFLADRSRNRLKEDTLEISSIFKWYREDFETGWRGADTLPQFLALYQDSLRLSDAESKKLAAGDIDIDFLQYDWSLNSIGNINP
ncbi:MAG TPA: DUF547 domain-containing protein [Desulfopila sp.]|nr:DUF547 domain-containing protein [Desulfopila sp.]